MKWHSLTASEILFLPQLAICVLVGLVFVILVAKKRKYFWPLLVIGPLMMSGLMINRLSYLDEIITLCILFGVFAQMAVRQEPVRFHRQAKDIWEKAHFWLFCVLMSYLIVQSVRGILVLNSPRKGLWIIFFVMLGIISGMIQSGKYPVPSRKKLNHIIASCGLGYFTFIILYGFFTETVRGISRWYLQTTEFGSSAQLMFPVAIVIPVALSLLRERNFRWRWIAWGTLTSCVVAAFYYDSRVALLAIAAFLILSLGRIGIRRFVLVVVLVFGLVIILVKSSDVYRGDFEHLAVNLTTLGARFLGYEVGGSGDIDRIIHIKVAFASIGDSLNHVLFGYGWRTHSTVIAPIFYELVAEYLPHRIGETRETVGTEGFTALVVDSGILGLLLVVVNFILVGRTIFRARKNPNRLLLGFSLISIFLWLFVINLSDNTLFYLAIMPQGILVQLSRQNSTLSWQKELHPEMNIRR